MKNSTITKSHKDVTSSASILSRYQDSMVGKRSFLYTIYYEICMVTSIFPGSIGMFLRKILWPRLFHSCGKGVLFGSNLILRHPNRISLGNRVVISEGCILDARNPLNDVAIRLDDDGILSTHVRIACKNGQINIGNRFGVGAQTVIHASFGNPVKIGNDVAIGPQCYITGGGNYNIDRTDIPIAQQGQKIQGGSIIEDGVWLGAKVSLLGGATVGLGSIVGTGAVITSDIPSMSIAVGVPAKVVKKRI
jgi:acetyltransferase-like isoleucine patch superfamily enzyme